MSIWGKVGGAAAGFFLGGGPIGAAIGALAGHAVFDREPSDTEKQIIFTIGVTALAAKMAKADGRPTDEEFQAFKSIVRIDPKDEDDVRRVYEMAHGTVAGFEGYAAQLGRVFRDRPGLLEDLLDALFFVAAADGSVHDAEVEYLREVARRFGLSDAAFNNLCASYGGPCDPDPYALFGIDGSATNDEVRKAYLKAVRENHPDRMIARGAPEEFLAVATEKLARINVAYEAIRKGRGVVMVKVVERPSPNFNERPPGVGPSILVMHYTGMKTAEDAMALLTDPDAPKRVSAHYTLDEDGTAFAHVPEDLRAWHAGISWWRGRTT